MPRPIWMQMKLFKIKVLAIQMDKVHVYVGENVDAVQDSVNYGEQTQVGATDTTQEQNTETENTQLVVVDGDNTVTEQYNYNDTVQDQTGFEGSVQDQDSTSAVEQGAAVTGDDNTAYPRC